LPPRAGFAVCRTGCANPVRGTGQLGERDGFRRIHTFSDLAAGAI
jgi:hypothetical protein